MPSGHKNKLLMLGGYTFAQAFSKRHWYCSKKKSGCKAKINMDSDLKTITVAHNVHTHDPPTYYVSKSGQYMFFRRTEPRN